MGILFRYHLSSVNEFSLTLSNWWLRYYFGPDHPFKIRLIDFLYRQLGAPRFLTKTTSGAILSLDLNDLVSREILRSGSYQPEILETFDRVATKDEVLWDVGAHVGSIGLGCATRPWCREVHCFEPFSPTAKQLSRNIGLNPQLNVKAHKVALAESNVPREFYAGLPTNSGVAGFGGQWGTKSDTLRPEVGDDFIAEKKAAAPTLIKIDAEGAELSVLQGLAQTFQTSPPKAVIFETHFSDEGTPCDAPVRSWLEERGYRIKTLASNHPGPTQNALAEFVGDLT